VASWCVVVPLRFRPRVDRSNTTAGWTVYIVAHIAVTALFERGLTLSPIIARFFWPNTCRPEMGEARVRCSRWRVPSRNAVSRTQCGPP